MSDVLYVVEHWGSQRGWVPIPNTARLSFEAARRDMQKLCEKRMGVWYRVEQYERAEVARSAERPTDTSSKEQDDG